jgi:response regulator of citrate/malate metabolism
MAKSKPTFNSKEKEILQLLNKSRAGLTAYQISEKTGISWVTVKKYLKKFVEKGIIDKV